MSTDGGVLLYGVREDSDGRPTVLSPIALKDQRERIDQIVQASIAEVPHIDVRELPLGDDERLRLCQSLGLSEEEIVHILAGDNAGR